MDLSRVRNAFVVILALSATLPAAVVFTDLGVVGPPASLGGTAVTPYSQVPQMAIPNFTDLNSIPGNPLGAGNIMTPFMVNKRTIGGGGWMTWSHGYTGAVYYTNGPTMIDLTIPAGTGAFYVYVEPNPFAVHPFTVTALGAFGSSASPQIQVNGMSGANGFGFHCTAGEIIQTIRIVSNVDFAFGEFGAGTCNPVASCMITSPIAGSTVSGAVAITFDYTRPMPMLSSFIIEFSTDAGVSFALATAHPTSPLPNPGVIGPGVGHMFVWDTVADSVGISGTQAVIIRISINDGMTVIICTQSFFVNNRLTCNITAPVGGAMAGGNVSITYDAISPSGAPITSIFEFSTNGGSTYVLATAAPGSPTANPDPLRPSPILGRVFIWNSQFDGVGSMSAQATTIRITVSSASILAECTLQLSIDNRPSCTITAPIVGSMAAGDVTVSFTGTDPSNDLLTSSFQYSTNGGTTFQAATAAPTSLLANPDVGRASPFAVSFVWDSSADMVGLVGSQAVTFRVTVSEGPRSSTCSVAMIMVANAPTCMLSAPTPGSTVIGDVSMTFGATDPSNDPVTSTFEFSTNAGATWASMSAAASSILTNPDPARGTPFVGVTFVWDSQADGAGLAGAQPTMIRISVSDGAAVSNCGMMIDVNNASSCVITSPLAGARVSDIVTTITYGGADSGGDPLDSTFEFSLDGGTTWNLATTAATSPTSNPDLGRATPFAGIQYDWNTGADVPTQPVVQNVMFRVRVTDGASVSTCTVMLTIDCLICGDCNLNMSAPNILDALHAAQIAVSLVVPSPVHMVCCDVNSSTTVDVIDALFIAQFAAGLPAVLMCP